MGGGTGAAKGLVVVGIMKMKSVLSIAILATATAAVLFLGSEAQEVKKGHHTDRISGAGCGLYFHCAISFSLFILTKCCDVPPVYFRKQKNLRCLNMALVRGNV